MKWTHAVWIVAGTLILGSPPAHAQPPPSSPSPMYWIEKAKAFAKGLDDARNQLRAILQAERRGPVGVGGLGDPVVSQMVSGADLDLTQALYLAYAYAWGGAPFEDYAPACRAAGAAVTALRSAGQVARQSPPGSWRRFSGLLTGLAFRVDAVRGSAGCW